MTRYLFSSIFLAITLSTSAGAADYKCDKSHYEIAKSRIIRALGYDILRGDEENASGVFVDDRYWNRMNFFQKSQLGNDFSCAVAGVGKGLGVIHFRSRMTGKVLGEWVGGRLTVF